jgi:TnpA family transposase
MSAAETARMMPQLSAASVRQAMRWAGDERRLADASATVLAFMRQHPIAATWGRSDLASSDMMSLETRQRVWQARLDPRRQTSSIGVYGHVLAGWGIFHAQPFVLNERQVGLPSRAYCDTRNSTSRNSPLIPTGTLTLGWRFPMARVLICVRD